MITILLSKEIYRKNAIKSSINAFNEFINCEITDENDNYKLIISYLPTNFKQKEILGRFQNYLLETSIEQIVREAVKNQDGNQETK